MWKSWLTVWPQISELFQVSCETGWRPRGASEASQNYITDTISVFQRFPIKGKEIKKCDFRSLTLIRPRQVKKCWNCVHISIQQVRINDALTDRVCRRVVLHFKWAVKLDQRRPLIHPQSIWPKVGAVLGVGQRGDRATHCWPHLSLGKTLEPWQAGFPLTSGISLLTSIRPSS